jgi:hypothetical protein
VGILAAILQIISKILGLFPNRSEIEESANRSQWKRNNDAIDADLSGNAWWVRNNSANRKN